MEKDWWGVWDQKAKKPLKTIRRLQKVRKTKGGIKD